MFRGFIDRLRDPLPPEWFKAAAAGDEKTMRKILSPMGLSYDIHAKDKNGIAPVLDAFIHDQRIAARLLLANGADIHTQSDDGMTLLHYATLHGCIELMSFLLERGVDVNAIPRNPNRRALVLAIKNNDEQSTCLLLRYGAKVYDPALGYENFIALLKIAVEKENISIVAMLLNSFITMEESPISQIEPLLIDVMRKDNLEMLQLLLKDSKINEIRIPTLLGYHRGLLQEAIDISNIRIINFLLEHGADVEGKLWMMDLQSNPLHIAASKGNFDVIRLLLAYNADPNAKDNDGKTAADKVNNYYGDKYRLVSYLQAVASGRRPRPTKANWNKPPVVTHASKASRTSHGHAVSRHSLPSMGSSMPVSSSSSASSSSPSYPHTHTTAVVSQGQTSLSTPPSGWFEAAEKGDITSLKALFENNHFDINAVNYYYETALHMAVYKLQKNYFNFFTQTRVQAGYMESIRFLLDNGADVHAIDYDGETALHRAAGNGAIETIMLLVGAGVNIDATNIYGETALHRLAGRGAGEPIRFLIKAGANIHVKDNLGETPLHKAASTGYHSIIDLLLKLGASVHAKNNHGETALHKLAQVKKNSSDTTNYQLRETSKWLLAYNINIQAMTNNRNTAAMLAKKFSNVGFAEYLDSVNQGKSPRPTMVEVNAERTKNRWFSAAGKGKIDILQQILEDKQFDINVINAGNTALIYAAARGVITTIVFLRDRGADVSGGKNTFSHAHGALYRAAEFGHIEAVRLLLACGVIINKDIIIALRDKLGRMMSLEGATKQLEIAQYLEDILSGKIARPTKTNWNTSVDPISNTETTQLSSMIGLPTNSHSHANVSKAVSKEVAQRDLFLAATLGDIPGIDRAILDGADVHGRNEKSRTALLLAAQYGHNDAIEHLMQNHWANLHEKDSHGNNALLLAAESGHNHTIDCLVQRYRMSVDEYNQNGYNALLLAVLNGHNSTLNHLVIHYYVDIRRAYVRDGRYPCWTPLCVAAAHGQHATIDHLVTHYKLNPREDNVLMAAVENGQTRTIDHLVTHHRVNIHIKGGTFFSSFVSPLMCAAYYGQGATVDHLLQTYQLDVHAQNYLGKTAAMMAREAGHEHLAQHLEAIAARTRTKEQTEVMPTLLPMPVARTPIGCVTALYPFTARDTSELSFVQGQVLEVLAQGPEGWLQCRLGGQEGLVPTNYLTSISSILPPTPTPPEQKPVTLASAVPTPSVVAAPPIISAQALARGAILGKGSFGIVYRGLWVYGGKAQDVAIKVLHESHVMESQSVEDFYHEAGMMASLDSPYVVKLLGITQTPNYSLVMEYAQKGSLYDLLHKTTTPLTWAHCYHFSLQIANGLAFLHGQGILHRDLKSPNVLLTADDSIKLADFGMAKMITHASKTSRSGALGTPAWMAPEILNSDNKYPYQRYSDVYSYGVIVWEMVARQKPHAELLPAQILMRVCIRREREPIPEGTPTILKQVIELCWQQEAKARPEMTEVAKTLAAMVVASPIPATNRCVSSSSYGGQPLPSDVSSMASQVGLFPTPSGRGGYGGGLSRMPGYDSGFLPNHASLPGGQGVSPSAVVGQALKQDSTYLLGDMLSRMRGSGLTSGRGVSPTAAVSQAPSHDSGFLPNDVSIPARGRWMG